MDRYIKYMAVVMLCIMLIGCGQLTNRQPEVVATLGIIGAVDGEVTSDKIERTKVILQSRAAGWGFPIQLQQTGDRTLTVKMPASRRDIVPALVKTAALEFKTPDGKTFLTGNDLVDAQAGIDPNTKKPHLNLSFSPTGKEAFAQATTQSKGKMIVILIDGEVITAPRVEEPITGGKARISGSYASLQEAENEAILLRSGVMPLKLSVISISDY